MEFRETFVGSIEERGAERAVSPATAAAAIASVVPTTTATTTTSFEYTKKR